MGNRDVGTRFSRVDSDTVKFESLSPFCALFDTHPGRDTVDISKGKILKTFSLFATSSCCDLRRTSERYERTQRVVRELFELFRAWEE